MVRLSELVRGNYNKCANCNKQENGYCPVIKKNIGWFIINDKQPNNCPKKGDRK